MTKTLHLPGIGACLLDIGRLTGDRYHAWMATPDGSHRDAQQRLLALLPTQEELPRIPETTPRVSSSHDELNSILARRGLGPPFAPLARNQFGFLSFFDLTFRWIERGEKTEIKIGAAESGRRYDGFRLSGPGCGVRAIRDEAFMGNAAARIATESDDHVWIWPKPSFMPPPADDLEAAETAARVLRFGRQAGDGKPGDLTAPCVSFETHANLDWLRGFSNLKAEIQAATQQSRFSLNEFGGRAAVETCGVGRSLGGRSVPRENIEIAEPFFLAVERPGIARPIFSAYVDFEDWKNPGHLAAP